MIGNIQQLLLKYKYHLRIRRGDAAACKNNQISNIWEKEKKDIHICRVAIEDLLFLIWQGFMLLCHSWVSNCKWWFDFLDRKKYARHLTLDLRWALRVSSFKQIILGHILHLKTDLHFNIQAGISAGNDSFSAAILDCVSSVLEPRWPDSWLSVRISLSFPVSESSSLMGRPACNNYVKHPGKVNPSRVKRSMYFEELLWYTAYSSTSRRIQFAKDRK